jgi:thiamine transporter 2/3
VEQDIFPIWTYAYFISVVVCGLLSEVFQYKPILIIGSFARLATRLILIFGTSLLMMQATQVTFGLACGTEVMFYSYIYYLVPNEQYQKLVRSTITIK